MGLILSKLVPLISKDDVKKLKKTDDEKTSGEKQACLARVNLIDQTNPK